MNCFGNNGCSWIIILIIILVLCSCCGNGGGILGGNCGCNNCNNDCC